MVETSRALARSGDFEGSRPRELQFRSPARLDIVPEFARSFAGTESHITVDELIQAREERIATIIGAMPPARRRSLLSVKRGEPDWSLLGVPGADELPAVRWRLENLKKLDSSKRALYTQSLAEILGISDSRVGIASFVTHLPHQG